MTLDARFIQPRPDHDAKAWARYAAKDIASLPDSVKVVVFFGDGLWRHPDPKEDGERPHRRADSSMGYTYRYKQETLDAVEFVKATGRTPLAYVNAWRWRKDGGSPYELQVFCLELLADGWSGIYFDGYPVAGKIKSAADDAAAAGFLALLKMLWPGVFIFLHGSGRDQPGLAEAECDAVLFGEWGDGWPDPGPSKPVLYAKRLTQMGVEPFYKPASKNPDGVKPSQTEWFDTFALIGSVRAYPEDALQFDRAEKVRAR